MNKMFTKIEFLKDNFKEYVTDMINSEHGENELSSNLYHSEGSVWTHTMCVCSKAQHSSDIIQWACLLHDIGKPKCRLQDTKVSFRNHASLGVFLALEVLKKANVNKEDIKIILRLIAKHQDLYTRGSVNTLRLSVPSEVQFFKYLRELSEYDEAGQIPREFHGTDLDENIKSTEEIPARLYDETLTVLIGTPLSGKSTYTKLSSEGDSEVVVSRDNELLKLAENNANRQLTYSEAWKYIEDNNLQDEVTQNTMKSFTEAVRNGKDIVIDMTNMSKKSRKKWTHVRGYHKKAVVFLSDLETILERNEERKGKIIPAYVIESMMKRFVWPDYANFDEIEVILT